jgi:hypothetical protein
MHETAVKHMAMLGKTLLVTIDGKDMLGLSRCIGGVWAAVGTCSVPRLLSYDCEPTAMWSAHKESPGMVCIARKSGEVLTCKVFE